MADMTSPTLHRHIANSDEKDRVSGRATHCY
jgi:hypothetical protein